MIKIEPGDLDASLPYATLLPLVETLLAHGNMLALEGDPFVLTRDGWCCELRDPIDFDLVAATLLLPETTACSRRRDVVADSLTRSFIRGGGWRGASLAVSEGNSVEHKDFFLALASLAEADHALMIRRYFKGMSTEALAAQTGVTRDALDTRLWRLRRNLLKPDPHQS